MRVPAVLVLLLAALVAVPVTSGTPAAPEQAGTLALTAKLDMRSQSSSRRFGTDCAPGVPATVECFDIRGTGSVRGLGGVTMTQLQLIDTAPDGCPQGQFAVLGSTIRLAVRGKGELRLTADRARECRALAAVLGHTRPFTIDGGTGRYAGATGSGTVKREAAFTGGGSAGKETFTGRLVVPGLAFDLVPPRIAGAASRTVTAPKGASTARVTYAVRATDATDGSVATSCSPKSGSKFKVGRTRVTCTATDSSGNTRRAAFTITVRPAG
ncbi:MAG: HYR domain-containing protein [Gaiellaceae bacterium]